MITRIAVATLLVTMALGGICAQCFSLVPQSRSLDLNQLTALVGGGGGPQSRYCFSEYTCAGSQTCYLPIGKSECYACVGYNYYFCDQIDDNAYSCTNNWGN